MSTLYKPRPERWPQFSLRGLLVALTLAVLSMPWAVTKYREWREPPFPHFPSDVILNIPYRQATMSR